MSASTLTEACSRERSKISTVKGNRAERLLGSIAFGIQVLAQG
jgi:hypothetical protein